MRGHRLASLLMALTIVPCSAGIVGAGESGKARDPWSQAHYDVDGRLVSAIGVERPGVPLSLSTERGTHGDRPFIETRYSRGFDTLQIEKIYEGDHGLDLIYTAGEERLVVSITLDGVSGEILAVYRLPDGQVFWLSVSGRGELLGGDLIGLRRALDEPMEITRLMRSFIRQKQSFEGHLPSSAESLVAPVMYVSCEAACAEGCGGDCAWECAHLGSLGCQICRSACLLGCVIGCSS